MNPGGSRQTRVTDHPDFDAYPSWSPAGVVADLLAGLVTGFGVDYLNGVAVLLGSAFDDVLRGNEGANTLKGLAGADDLAGRGGDDRLLGGRGDDDLDGGAGADTCLQGSGTGLVFRCEVAG